MIPLFLALGADVSVDHPTVHGRVGVGAEATRWLAVEATATVPLYRHDDHIYALQRQVGPFPLGAIDQGVEVRHRTGLHAQITPLTVSLGQTRLQLGGLVGVGAVRTVDDGRVLAVSGPSFAATRREWHPATTVGLIATIRGDAAGVRIRGENTTHVENYDSTIAWQLQRWWTGAEVALWF